MDKFHNLLLRQKSQRGKDSNRKPVVKRLKIKAKKR